MPWRFSMLVMHGLVADASQINKDVPFILGPQGCGAAPQGARRDTKKE
jgi:hypothetical protein